MEAWRVTVEAARALGARIVVVQCPASFIPSAEDIENMRRFFRAIDALRLFGHAAM